MDLFPSCLRAVFLFVLKARLSNLRNSLAVEAPWQPWPGSTRVRLNRASSRLAGLQSWGSRRKNDSGEEQNDNPRHSYLPCHFCLRVISDRAHWMAFDEGQSTTSCPAEGEEMNANELFRKDEKPLGQWFMLALLAFTIIDYFLLGRG